MHKISSHQSSTEDESYCGKFFWNYLLRSHLSMGKERALLQRKIKVRKAELIEIHFVKEAEESNNQADNQILLKFMEIVLRNQKKW